MEIYKGSWGTPRTAPSSMEVFTEDGIIIPLNKYGFVNDNNETLDLDYITPASNSTTNKIYYKDKDKVGNSIQFVHWSDYPNAGIKIKENSYVDYLNLDGSASDNNCRIFTIIIPTLDGLLFYLTNSGAEHGGETWKKFELNQWFRLGINGWTKGLICYFNSTDNKIGNITCKNNDYNWGGSVEHPYPIYRAIFKFSPTSHYYFDNSAIGTINTTITEYPYFENFKSNHNNWDYVNYNSNTCVLAKVIYNNQYINNLYYIITSPFELPFTNFTTDQAPDFKYNYNIFSFNGHTYFNFFGNLAVELPD